MAESTQHSISVSGAAASPPGSAAQYFVERMLHSEFACLCLPHHQYHAHALPITVGHRDVLENIFRRPLAKATQVQLFCACRQPFALGVDPYRLCASLWPTATGYLASHPAEVSYAAWLLRQGYQQVMTSGYGHGLKQQRLVLASTHHLLLDEVVTVFPGVYHPWHDRSSHAMLEAMAEEIMPGMRVYIVGLGSGVDARYAARLGAYVRGVDINPSAVWNTRYLFATDAAAAMLIPRLEHVSCAWLFADLAEGEAPFDRIFFNVPSDDTSIQVLSDCAVRDPGRRILRAFLTASRQFLKPTGKSVFVHGEPDAVRHEAAKLRLPVQERRASNDYAIFQVPRDAA